MSTDTRTPHGVGLTTRDGRFEVVSCEWDHNGSYLVVVVDMGRLTHDIMADAYAPFPRAARDLARRVDPMGKVRWTRADCLRRVYARGVERVGYQFTVSRLDAQYR